MKQREEVDGVKSKKLAYLLGIFAADPIDTISNFFLGHPEILMNKL